MTRFAMAAPAAVTIAALALAACGDTPDPGSGPPAEEPTDGSDPPRDEEPDEEPDDEPNDEPEEQSPDEAGPPTEPWPEPGTAVSTDGPVDVLDDGTSTELCLGGMLESYPPQCSGIEMAGFDWDNHEGEYQNADGVRWGSFQLIGTYDPLTQTLSVERSAPADDGELGNEPVTEPEREVSAEELPDEWPGLLGSVGSGQYYPAFVEVIYDDGTLQGQLDEEFGAGNVQLHAVLTAAE